MEVCCSVVPKKIFQKRKKISEDEAYLRSGISEEDYGDEEDNDAPDDSEEECDSYWQSIRPTLLSSTSNQMVPVFQSTETVQTLLIKKCV